MSPHGTQCEKAYRQCDDDRYSQTRVSTNGTHREKASPASKVSSQDLYVCTSMYGTIILYLMYTSITVHCIFYSPFTLFCFTKTLNCTKKKQTMKLITIALLIATVLITIDIVLSSTLDDDVPMEKAKKPKLKPPTQLPEVTHKVFLDVGEYITRSYLFLYN